MLDELCALFPSANIHIGGDEADSKQWANCQIAQTAMKQLGCKDAADLQIHFQNKLIACLESKGRHAIIWNNTCRTTINKRAINQFWRWSPPMLHVVQFAKAGYKILVSDEAVYYYAHHPSLQRAYQYDPRASELPRDLWSNEMGAEGCAWSERLPDAKALEKNVFPLIFVHAELDWTQPDRKAWASFAARLPSAIQRCRTMDVNYNERQTPRTN